MAYLDLKLERDGFNQPWGLRMVGGLDVGSPLTISRVIAGTASEGVLRVGDVITAIKGQDVSAFSHQEALDLFKSAGNTIVLGVARGLANGAPVSAPRTSAVDSPSSCARKTAQVGKPPARKFSDEDARPPVSMGEFIQGRYEKRCEQSKNRDITDGSETVLTPTTFLPTTEFSPKPKTQMEIQMEEAFREEHQEKEMICDQPPSMANLVRDREKEQYQYAYDKDREQLTYQPYRSTPLITPGPKVRRDTPIVASYLRMHPDPQVRGAAPHVSQVSGGLSCMLGSANDQLAKKVASQVRTVAGSRPVDRLDTGRSPRIIHHQFNTPAGLYSQDNMASSIHQQTGISPVMGGGPRKEFSIQNSETLKMIMEEDSQKPAVQQKPKSHVVYDVHEAKVYRPTRF